MVAAIDFYQDKADKTAHTTAGISTSAFAVLLLLILWLITIKLPNPPIPPDTEVPEIQVVFPEGMLFGGNNMAMGGGSQGETGKPGTQVSEPTPSNPTPSNPGAITNPNSDAAYSPAKPTPGAEDASVSAETQALLDKLKNKKNNTAINVGGDGSGSPYSSGMGDDNGIGKGPGDGGLPGTGGNGGKHYRKIIFKPDIGNPTQEEGVVAVIVIVDRAGNVTHAEVSPTGSTTGNPLLKSTATQSAYKIKFDEDPNGPELLKLTVNINFTLTK